MLSSFLQLKLNRRHSLGACGILSTVVTVAITLTYEVMTPVAAVIIGSYDSISQV